MLVIIKLRCICINCFTLVIAVKDVEKKHQEEQEELEKEKLELQLKVEELAKHEEILQAKVSAEFILVQFQC